MRHAGYTLLEIIISMAILTVISVFVFAAVATSVQSARTAEAETTVQSNVRDVLMVMAPEIEIAAKDDDASMAPPLVGLRVRQNVSNTVPVEIVFQVPVDPQGSAWSAPITYRYVNEDLNGNGLLDAGEDLNGNGLLDRRIFRLQDLTGDGDLLDDNEQRPVGGSNDLSAVQMARNGDVVQITLSSTAQLSRHDENRTSATATTQIYIRN